MDKNQLLELVIREMTEAALLKRRENCSEEEKHLYEETAVLSEKRQKILENLSPEDCQVLEDYHVNTEQLADHECRYLYVQGAMDCVRLLKKLGAL